MIRTLLTCAATAILSLASSAAAQQSPQPAEAKTMWAYIGTSGKGIYLSRFDPTTGQLTPPALVAETKGASYIWPHPSGKTLLATGQLEVDGKPQGALRSYAIETGSGKLVELNAQPSGGTGPCYVSTDRAGRFALAANYGSGSASVLPIRPDGKLDPASAVVQHQGTGPNAKRQTGPHAHNFDFDPAERFALCCDLGIDQVKIYRFDSGKLTEVEPAKVAPGAGPRHLTFSADGKFLYVLNEMGCTVTAFSYDPDTARTTELQTLSLLPPDYHQSDKDTGSEIFVHPSGKFLYASNRGHDSIVRFALDPATGKLSSPAWTPSGGTIPRYFGFDPTGQWLLAANQGTGNIVTFRINPSDGSLTPAGDPVQVGAPTCIKFLPAQ